MKIDTLIEYVGKSPLGDRKNSEEVGRFDVKIGKEHSRLIQTVRKGSGIDVTGKKLKVSVGRLIDIFSSPDILSVPYEYTAIVHRILGENIQSYMVAGIAAKLGFLPGFWGSLAIATQLPKEFRSLPSALLCFDPQVELIKYAIDGVRTPPETDIDENILPIPDVSHRRVNFLYWDQIPFCSRFLVLVPK